MSNQIKTALLLGSLAGFMLLVGQLIGGQQGLYIAFFFAIFSNFAAYFYSDKFVLRMYRGRELSVTDYPRIHQILNKLCKSNDMMKPKLYLIPSQNPNAFATGRNQKNSVIGLTQGIIDLLDEKELKGVIAHELAHIKNKDILIGSIAATMAATIAFLANMAQWSAIFGSRDRNNNIFSLLIIAMITPIIAGIIQMSISRSREFQADKTGAIFAKDTKGLSSALEKLEKRSKIVPMKMGNNTTSHLFIVNPFSRELLASHPSTKARIQRLNKLKLK